MTENEISYAIRGAVFKVHSRLGPGLLETAYEAALAYELKKAGLEVKTQVGLPFEYEEITLEIGYRIDILVNDLVIIELKSVEALTDVHHKQLLTYLTLSGKKLGLLINFNTAEIAKSIVRIANKL
jgi:GxxExxY protein